MFLDNIQKKNYIVIILYVIWIFVECMLKHITIIRNVFWMFINYMLKPFINAELEIYSKCQTYKFWTPLLFVYEYSTPIWMFLDYIPVNITNIANVLWIFVECMAGCITNVENVLWMFVKCMHDC